MFRPFTLVNGDLDGEQFRLFAVKGDIGNGDLVTTIKWFCDFVSFGLKCILSMASVYIKPFLFLFRHFLLLRVELDFFLVSHDVSVIGEEKPIKLHFTIII